MKRTNYYNFIKATHVMNEKKCKIKNIPEIKQKEIDFCQNSCPYDDCIGNKCKLLKNLLKNN